MTKPIQIITAVAVAAALFAPAALAADVRSGVRAVPRVDVYAAAPSVDVYSVPSVDVYSVPSVDVYSVPSVDVYSFPNVDVYSVPTVDVYVNPRVDVYVDVRSAIRHRSHAFHRGS